MLDLGSSGDAVARWQAFLRIKGFDCGPIDGEYGPKTRVATEAFAFARSGRRGACLDDQLLHDAIPEGFIGDVPVVRTRHFTPAKRAAMRWIVIHSMEMPEKGGTAEACARYFSTTAREASAHYCIDATSIVQCVDETAIAWHAPGANRFGLGMEHAGFARQTTEEWADSYSMAMLDRSTRLAALVCARWSIPPVFVDARGLARGERGITTHAEVTDAFSAGRGHWDPGPGFPRDWYVARVAEVLSGRF